MGEVFINTVSMIIYRARFSSLLFFIFYLLLSCKNYHRNKTHAGVSLTSIQKGETLARKYCQSCHAFPEPAGLNARSWEEGVLPAMGPMLGIFSYQFQQYPSSRRDKNLDTNFYPSHPVIGFAEWQNIIDYYSATSPDSLPPQHRNGNIKTTLPFFEIQTNTNLPYKSITFIKIVSSGSERQVLLADKTTQRLLKLNDQLVVIDSLNAAGTIADIAITGDTMLLCDMGQINPNNGAFGKARLAFNNINDKMRMDSSALLKSLVRPVQIVSTDLDNDGRTDYIACEFGFMKGDLSWYQNKGTDSFQRRILSGIPGAIKLYVQDYNKDGLPDLWVLFAQGEEGIFLFTNKGNGQFQQQQLLRFPPYYGSTSFELADFNKDGFDDIIYTCGDNADFSKVMKPYHGVYIFLNDGNKGFQQKYFFPINGCFKALSRDFDHDGDLDIGAISFFADYATKPEEGFIYLENLGNFSFQPYTFPENKSGRWLTMDAGDLDGDGKVDLILGNFAEGPVLKTPLADWKKGPSFILLKNISGK